MCSNDLRLTNEPPDYLLLLRARIHLISPCDPSLQFAPTIVRFCDAPHAAYRIVCIARMHRRYADVPLPQEPQTSTCRRLRLQKYREKTLHNCPGCPLLLCRFFDRSGIDYFLSEKSKSSSWRDLLLKIKNFSVN